MDLHDEIGSGLGSIGILSNVVTSGTVNEEQRQSLTRKISETADELGSSLTDIVWSLRSDATTLESLAYRLTKRAENLFSSDPPHFQTSFPNDWPEVNLSLATRRNILLIATESLHNAAKHAQAKNVVLGFEQMGRKWRLWVADDGCGLSNEHKLNLSGMGMQSIKQRAKEIGAEVSFTSNNGSGTIVSLTFDPQARD